MRLIDADNLIYAINHKTIRTIDDVLLAIKEQPTAFDLEKAIKEICAHKFCRAFAVEDCDKYANCESCMAEQIIEITKSKTEVDENV